MVTGKYALLVDRISTDIPLVAVETLHAHYLAGRVVSSTGTAMSSIPAVAIWAFAQECGASRYISICNRFAGLIGNHFSNPNGVPLASNV